MRGERNVLLGEEEGGEEVNEGLLDPGLAEDDEKDEDEQMDGSHDEEARRHTHESAKPEGEGE